MLGGYIQGYLKNRGALDIDIIQMKPKDYTSKSKTTETKTKSTNRTSTGISKPPLGLRMNEFEGRPSTKGNTAKLGVVSNISNIHNGSLNQLLHPPSNLL